MILTNYDFSIETYLSKVRLILLVIIAIQREMEC
jgi:hypothetical protein